jgi:hypothetical protein
MFKSVDKFPQGKHQTKNTNNLFDYYKYHSVHPPKELTMNEILPLVHTETEPGLDIALFIGTMQHISSLVDYPHDQPLELNNIEKLLQRTEEILYELSKRIINNSSE